MEKLKNGACRTSVTFSGFQIEMLETFMKKLGIKEPEVFRRALNFYYVEKFLSKKEEK